MSSTLNPELTTLLVCPVCRGDLTETNVDASPALLCAACSLAYPVRDGIPVMLAEEAISMVNRPLQA